MGSYVGIAAMFYFFACSIFSVAVRPTATSRIGNLSDERSRTVLEKRGESKKIL
jgi:hypothetical protein